MLSFSRAARVRACALPFVRRSARRNLSQQTREAPAAPPPPPEGSPGSSGSAGKLLALVALAGGAYYFREDIADLVKGKGAPGASGENVDDTGLDVKALRSEADELGKRLQSEIEQENLRAKAEEGAKKSEAQHQQQKATATVFETPSTTKGSKKDLIAQECKPDAVDWDALRKEIVEVMDDYDHDDGSYGPIFVRLAWHNAGTYDKNTKKGGSEGALMRYKEEAGWGANAGLDKARARLEPVKANFPEVTYSDLWSFAGTVAIEEMGGPKLNWRPGRRDFAEEHEIQPDGLLPDADGRDKPERPASHLREIFYRMGFNDREIVALSGAHVLGRCHQDASGYEGPWTRTPTTFSNEYFTLLLNERWSQKKTHKGSEWKGPLQYEDRSGDLMMLPTDMALVWDEKLKSILQEFASNEETFKKEFAKAWEKLQELGVAKFNQTWLQYFGLA